MWTKCYFKRAAADDVKQDFGLVWGIMHLIPSLLFGDTG